MDDYWTGSSSRRERHAIANPSANRINIITDRPNICSRYWRSSRRIAKMSVRRRTTGVSPTFRFFSDPSKEFSKSDVCAPGTRPTDSDRVLQCGIFGAPPTAAVSFSVAVTKLRQAPRMQWRVGAQVHLQRRVPHLCITLTAKEDGTSRGVHMRRRELLKYARASALAAPFVRAASMRLPHLLQAFGSAWRRY